MRGHTIAVPYERLLADLGDDDGRGICDPPDGCDICCVVGDPLAARGMDLRAPVRRASPPGRAREDGPALAALTESWASGSEMARRLGKSVRAAQQALHRAQVRYPALVESHRHYGYRRRAS